MKHHNQAKLGNVVLYSQRRPKRKNLIKIFILIDEEGIYNGICMLYDLMFTKSMAVTLEESLEN